LISGILVVVILFISNTPRLRAQGKDKPLVLNREFVKTAQQAIDSVYDFNYAASEKILKPWKEKYPHSPLWQFWKGLHVWWKMLPDLYNKSHDKELVFEFSKADYMCSRILSNDHQNLDALVIKAASNGFLARYYSNREEWLKCFQYGKQAMDALFLIQKIDPSIPDIKFGLGIYNYYTAYLPEEYPLLNKFSWILPEGDKEKGIKMLKTAADSSAFVRPESIYFLGRIYMTGEHQIPLAIKYFQILNRKYQHNAYYKMILAQIYYENEDYYRAMNLIDTSLSEAEKNPGPFTYALKEHMYSIKGLILFNFGETKKAIDFFKKTQQISKSSPEGVNRNDYLLAGYYLGRIYQGMKKDKLAQKYYGDVGKIHSDSKFVTLAKKSLDGLKKR